MHGERQRRWRLSTTSCHVSVDTNYAPISNKSSKSSGRFALPNWKIKTIKRHSYLSITPWKGHAILLHYFDIVRVHSLMGKYSYSVYVVKSNQIVVILEVKDNNIYPCRHIWFSYCIIMYIF